MKQATEKGGAYQVTLSGDITVNLHHARLWDITPDTTGRTVTLPDARLYRPGGVWAIVNRGADSIAIDDNAGGSLETALAQDKGLLIGLVSNATQAGVWTLFQRDVGVVSNPALAVLGYHWGGHNGFTGGLDDTWEWNPQINTWTTKTDRTAGVQTGCGFTIAARGYTLQTGTSFASDDHYEYDPDTWTSRTVVTYTVQRACAFGINDGTEALGGLFGGQRGTAPTTFDPTPLIYSATGNSWSTGTDQSGGRINAAAFGDGDDAHVCGGRANDGPSTFDDNHELYDASADSWSIEVDMSWPYRGEVTGVTCTSNGYIICGQDSDSPSATSTFDNCTEYDTSTASFSDKTDHPLGRISRLGCMSVDDKCYAVLGYEHANLTLSDACEEFDPTIDSWRAAADAPDEYYFCQRQQLSIQS